MSSGTVAPAISGGSSSGLDLWRTRQTRPWSWSRRSSRSEYCMWPINGLNQSTR